MTDSLRIRVQRIIRDDFNPEDLIKLFLSLRTRSWGKETVREIGDFVAHADERVKGITTDTVRDFFTFLRFYYVFREPVDLRRLPPHLPHFVAALHANLRMLPEQTIKAATGLSRKHAARTLEGLTAKLTSNHTGGLHLASASQPEVSLIQCLTGNFVVKPAFTGEMLFADFCFVLEKNNLLDTTEREALASLREPLSVFALAQLHQTKIDLGDKTRAELSLCSNTGSGNLGIIAAAEVASQDGGSIRAAAPMFTTSLQAVMSCEPDLFTHPGIHHWDDVAITMTTRKTLAKLS